MFLRDDGNPVPDKALTTPDGKPGLAAQYGDWDGVEMEPGAKPKVLATRVEANVDLEKSGVPAEAQSAKRLGVEWKGFLTAPATGDYLVGFRAKGFARIAVDGRTVAMQWNGDDGATKMGHAHLEAGQKAALELDVAVSGASQPEAQLLWAPVNNAPSPQAVAAAKQADVVIAAVGITSQLEGEEMPVNQPGFLGGDRTSIDLPQPEEELVEAVAATGKPLVVVLMNGSALGVNWINAHANAVLEAWYSGEEGGAAIAETLSGKNDPAGRLPVTFYKDVSQLPNFEDYSMANRTYRYFTGKPLYPFGYGLSYTTFAYSDLSVPAQPVAAGAPVEAEATVTNTGKVAGDEVVQLYLKFPPVAGAPRIALRGFERVHLDPGQSQKVHFTLKNRDLGMVTAVGEPEIAGGEYTVSIGGGQPGTGAANVEGHFEVAGTVDLPE